MIQYIYFVKCPNCEDEHFDFFDEAKEFAISCLSKKPIITQTEVCRNDFGECTDHCDLGTVWSWEDMMKDTEKPEASVFSKGDFGEYNPDNDPEFADDDFFAVNSIDESVAEAYTDPETECIYNDNIECTTDVDCADCPNNPKNTVYNGKTLKELVEEMEENEDEVECTWCNDLFPKDMCKKEVNLGWLCSRCADGIMSRGETLTFKENNYWDFLDEKFDIDFEDESSSDVLDAASDEGTDEDFFNQDFEEAFDPFDHHDPDYSDEAAADALADRIDRAKDAKYDDALDSLDEPLPEYRYAYDEKTGTHTAKRVNEGYDSRKTVDLEYSDLTFTVCGPKRDVDDWDELEESCDYVYQVYQDDVATVLWDNFMTEEDAKDVPGGLEALEDVDAFEAFLETHFDDLVEKYYDQLLDYFEDDAREKCASEYED